MTASSGYGIVLSPMIVKRAVEKITKEMSDHERKLRHFNMSSKYYENLSDDTKAFMAELDIDDLENINTQDRNLEDEHFDAYLEEHFPLLEMVPVGISDSAIVVKDSHQVTAEYASILTSAVTSETTGTLEKLIMEIQYPFSANWIFWNN